MSLIEELLLQSSELSSERWVSSSVNVITGSRQVCKIEKQPFACAALSFCLTSSVLVLDISVDLGGA